MRNQIIFLCHPKRTRFRLRWQPSAPRERDTLSHHNMRLAGGVPPTSGSGCRPLVTFWARNVDRETAFIDRMYMDHNDS